jgi:hypothetical protein
VSAYRRGACRRGALGASFGKTHLSYLRPIGVALRSAYADTPYADPPIRFPSDPVPLRRR